MKVEIKVLCDSIEEAAISLAQLAEGQRLINGDESPTAPTADPASKPAVVKTEEPTPATEADAPEPVAEPEAETPAAEAPKKKGRKSKVEALAAILEPTNAPVESTAALTVEDARAALQKVMDKFGMPGATAFIAEQGYKRITEIPADQFEAFITACNKKVA